MANKESRNILQQQRVDTTDLKAIESGVVFDFKDLLHSMISATPFILQGFTIDTQSIIGQAQDTLQVQVDSGVVWMPDSNSGAMLRVIAGRPNEVMATSNAKVVGSWSANQTNYLGVRFKRSADPSTSDLVNLWDVDAKVEFSKTVPRGLVLDYEFVISTIDFSDTAPIAIVQTTISNNVSSIKNAKQELLRLGRGGTAPNADYEFSFSPANENPLLATSSLSPNPFEGGDHELKTLKDWMDAVMSEIKRMKGSALWYSNGSSLVPGVNLSNLWADSVGSLITGAGRFEHDETTPGLLTWTSQINIRSVMSNLSFLIPAGNVTLSDREVAYIQLVRNQDFQAQNTFTFVNGSPTVTGQNTISGIVAGDFIKFVADDQTKWAKVLTVVGSTITLTANYAGASAVGKAVRAQNSYTVQTDLPEAITASADVYWLARRDDNGVPAATVDTIGNSGAMRTGGDTATIKTTAAHGLAVGQVVAVSGVSDTTFNTTATIDSVPTSTSFTYYNPGTNVGQATAGGGSVSVRARIYLRTLAEVEQGEDVEISDTTVDNILKFIGSQSESDTTPPYTQTPNALASYDFDQNDSLTEAISQTAGNVNDILTTLDQPSYDEAVLIQAPVTSGTILTIPVNSRLGGSPQQFYTVGKGALEVYLNGQYLSPEMAGSWTEVGSIGTDSDQIQIDQDLVVGDEITYRIDATGGPGSGGGGGGGGVTSLNTLVGQVTLAAGSNITLTPAGNTITIQATTGSGTLAISTKTANYTLTLSDSVILVDATAGSLTMTLPSAASSTGKVFYVKKIDSSANSVIIDGAGAETIDGATTITTVIQYEAYTIISNGSFWSIL